MPDPKEDSEYAEKLKGGKKSPLTLIIAVVAAAAAGAGGVWFMPRDTPQTKPQASPAAAPQMAKIGPIIPIDPIIANLNEVDSSRYLKAAIHLELLDDSNKSDVEAAMIPIKNHMLIHFSSLTVDDTQGGEKKIQLQKSLKDIVNKFLGGKIVKAVYFTELVVQ